MARAIFTSADSPSPACANAKCGRLSDSRAAITVALFDPLRDCHASSLSSSSFPRSAIPDLDLVEKRFSTLPLQRGCPHRERGEASFSRSLLRQGCGLVRRSIAQFWRLARRAALPSSGSRRHLPELPARHWDDEAERRCRGPATTHGAAMATTRAATETQAAPPHWGLFGFLSIPMLSWLGFTALTAILLAVHRRSRGVERCGPGSGSGADAGKYWETLDRLYRSQSLWTQHHQVRLDQVWQLLATVGLDLERSRADMNDPRITAIIEQDLADAETLGVRFKRLRASSSTESRWSRSGIEPLAAELSKNYPPAQGEYNAADFVRGLGSRGG